MENGKWKMENGKALWRLFLPFAVCHLPFSILLLGGCRPIQPGVKKYTGPTESMSEVFHAINENNRKLPTLFASIREMEASIVDDRGKRHDEVLGGRLLYQAPSKVLVIGEKPVVGDVVRLGSNDEQYWLVAKSPGPDTAWWGWYRHLGKPCAQPIPIRPDLVLEVLGITTLNEDFNQLPAPVMRYNNDADAYMFLWNAKLPDRWIAVKEVWYDRASKRPTRVALFDANGRPVLHAFLARHKPVKLDNVPEREWPVVAVEYRLFFPDSGS
ncbi:MAG: hypothetical protein ABIP55_15850, partial [Tepidisphaeraceae bacterium]